MKQGKTNIYSTEIDKLILNSPAIADVQNLPVFKAIADVQNSSVFKAIADVQNSSVFKAIADVQNSPVLKAIADFQNSPALKAIADVQRSPVFPFSKSLKDIANLQSLALSSFEGIEIYSTKPLKIPIVPILEHERDKNIDDLQIEAKVAYDTNNLDFNKKAYGFLCDLEVGLRSLIHERIVIPYGSNLASKIPEDILNKWGEKKEKDPLNCEDNKLIDYSDFTDLKIILDKGRNKELFSDLFNHEQYKALITKLHELDPIRKQIAHFRPLTKIDLERLIIYHRDILIVVQNK